MNDDLFEVGTGPPFERIEQLSRRAEKLPPEVRELIGELLEAYNISVEELQVAAEELNQQNAELMATREEIEIQRQRYRDMFEFAPDGYLVTDPEGIIREVNHAVVELLGVSRQNLISKPMVLFVMPEERTSFHLRLDRLIGEKGARASDIEWEMQFQSRRGPEFPAALTVAPIHDLKGELTGLRWLLRNITSSKRAEERERLLAQTREQHRMAQEANRLLHALIETMPIGALISDADGMIVLTNTAGREILGGAVSGSSETPEQMPLRRALREKQPIRDIEVLIRRPDGSERTILASAAPILDDAGEILSGITVFQDITERKQSRTALRQNAERLEVLRQADQVILAAGTLDELVESVLPFTRELAPCQVASVLAFDLGASEAKTLGVLANGKTQLGENEKNIPLDENWPLDHLAQGEMVTFEADSIPAEALGMGGAHYLASVPLVAQGELLGVLNLGSNEQINLEEGQREIINQMAGELAIGIRQIRLHEKLQEYASKLERTVIRRTGALRESEERFRIILETAFFGIALLDEKGRIVVSNPALQNMTGYSETELKGMTFSDYSHPEEAESNQELYRALASLESGHYQIEKRYVRKDGQVRWSALAISRIRHAVKDKPWLAVAIMEDITEKKKIQESLTRTERLALAGRLGASLAHEINNPIQAVIGCLGLAEEMLEKESGVSQYLEIAMQELERTADIVTQLRDLSRESEIKEKELIDLNALVEKVLLLTRKRAQTQGVEVEWQPAGDLPPVILVPERMQQVLLNLVLNAIEAMAAGGTLRVSTALIERPRGFEITIADEGVGIEPERLQHVFEPFMSNRPEGLGLGLFISRNIVEEHSGRIEIESRLGKGTTCTVWLPG